MSHNINNIPGKSKTTSEEVLEIGARLANGPSDRLILTAFKCELDDQIGLLTAMNRVDLAHTVVMMESGTVSHDTGSQLLGGIEKLNNHPEEFTPEPAFGDLYTNREAWLRERSYPVDWLGSGRARREAITTGFQITVRELLLDLMDALIGFNHCVLAKSSRYMKSLMPDYTYLQAAQPTTFGHYLIGFAYPVLRDMERLQSLFVRINRSPAGCGSTNGSRIPQHRERLRELLGFEGLVDHARDAMWQADLPIEIAAILTAILVNLDRLAEDLQIFATEEFALIDFDDRHARASKIMPQKKNPFALTHVRGLANSMIGTLASSAAMGRTPSGQPDNRLRLYGMIPRAIKETRDAVELMAEVVSFLTFNEIHAQSKLDNSFAMATDLAEVLVLRCGLSFRQAHRLVGHLVRIHQARGGFALLTVEELAAAAQSLGHCIDLTQESLQEGLNPKVAVLERQDAGGASPSAMEAMYEHCGKVLKEAAHWSNTCRIRFETAEKLLQKVIQDFIELPDELASSNTVQAASSQSDDLSEPQRFSSIE